MHALIVSARDCQCQYFYDWLRIFVKIQCKCLDLIDLTDFFNPDISCLVFAHEKDLKRFRGKFSKIAGKLPPVIAPEPVPAAKSIFTSGISSYDDKRQCLDLVKKTNHVQASPEEMAENIFIFISRYPFYIGNVDSIAGCLSKQEYRRAREAFKNQFGLSMRKWLTIQKIKAILGKMRSRDEFGQYLSLAWECGFRDDAAFATFLRLEFGKRTRSIEEEAKELREKELMEKIASPGIL